MKKFEIPEMEVAYFEVADIITASASEPTDPEAPVPGGNGTDIL